MVDLFHLLFFSQGRHFIKTHPEFLSNKLTDFHLNYSVVTSSLIFGGILKHQGEEQV